MKDAILGINLDGTTLHLGKVRDDAIEKRFFRRVTSDADEQTVLDQVFEGIDRVMDDEVAGIGFGAPSVVDLKAGTLYSVENIPSWREVRLKEILEERYGVTAYVNNDANAFVVGELHFGHGKGYRDVVGVILGTGLGVGVAFDGRLCSGANGGVGEIGKIPYRDHDLEYYCSRKFFNRKSKVQELLLRGRAERGEAEARELYREFGRHLGHVTQILLYAYDPEIVIFGGSLCETFPLFRESMMETMESVSLQRSVSRLNLAVTEHKTDGLILGAAALYLDSVGRS